MTFTKPPPGVGLIGGGKSPTSKGWIGPGLGVCGELLQGGSGREAHFRQVASYYLCLFSKDT